MSPNLDRLPSLARRLTDRARYRRSTPIRRRAKWTVIVKENLNSLPRVIKLGEQASLSAPCLAPYKTGNPISTKKLRWTILTSRPPHYSPATSTVEPCLKKASQRSCPCSEAIRTLNLWHSSSRTNCISLKFLNSSPIGSQLQWPSTVQQQPTRAKAQ